MSDLISSVVPIRLKNISPWLFANGVTLNTEKIKFLGGHFSDIRDHRYRTEPDIGSSDIGLKRAESDIISDIGVNFYHILNIRHSVLCS
jgi:hypothetical protein